MKVGGWDTQVTAGTGGRHPGGLSPGRTRRADTAGQMQTQQTWSALPKRLQVTPVTCQQGNVASTLRGLGGRSPVCTPEPRSLNLGWKPWRADEGMTPSVGVTDFKEANEPLPLG